MTPPQAGQPLLNPTWLRLAPLMLAVLLGACATAPAPKVADSTPAVATAPVAAAPAVPATPPAAVPAAPPLAVVVPQPQAMVPIAIDPLRPTELLDLGAPGTQTDLWTRVRQGVAIPDLQNERVDKWQQWYASRPDYVQRMTERGGRYLFHIIEEVNRRGLPTELALLPFIESAFNPQAMSTAKASGMRQFIPGTGRDFSLRQNVFRDDRRDVLASTRAALDYLQMLHGMFGDWQLALAAYNWGQGSVQRAITRNQRAGLPTDYDSLRMPDETRNYLPKLQAVENIVANPQAFGMTLPALQNHPYFVSVGLDRDIDLDLAARLAGVPLDEFKQLNPQMNKPVILAAGTPQVLLPYDAANRFMRAVGQHRGNLASWTAWVAPRTVKPAEAARLVGMDEAQLRTVNNIPKGMLVKAGSTLLVARAAHRTDDVTGQIADNATLALAPDMPPLRRISFKAGKKGDSVAAVARRYRVRADQVAQWNGTSAAAHFKPGQTVVVMVANKSKRLAGAQAPAKASAAKRLNKPPATARSRAPAN
ncbi:MAG: transglycosylase SLT domain-containing protein [Aquabacterium sp.]|nr:transglycosylase SLT domain-containing protein [Aquabacterium sp.]